MKELNAVIGVSILLSGWFVAGLSVAYAVRTQKKMKRLLALGFRKHG